VEEIEMFAVEVSVRAYIDAPTEEAAKATFLQRFSPNVVARRVKVLGEET
jgi:hypothetical protein